MIKEIVENKYIRFLAIFLLITLLLYVINGFINKHRTYVADVVYYKVPNESIDYISEEENDYYLFSTYSEYVQFLDDYGISGDLTAEDFQKRNYISYFLNVSDCSERINGITDVKIEDGVVNFYVDVTVYACDECDSTVYLYFVPVSKEHTVKSVKYQYNFVTDKRCSGNAIDDKPILYLYPNQDTNISVKLEHPELLLSTYPKYNDGWNLLIHPNGDMYDDSGKYYYALYWDELDVGNVDFHEGFYVTKDDAIDFLEEKLSIIGLSDRERNEFIMYWLPKLESNEKNLIYFELTEERELRNRLLINPQPDSLLRVIMHVKKVNKKMFKKL